SYQENLEQTLEDAEQISIVDEDEEGVGKFLSWIENAAATVVDYVTGLLSRFLEAIAVMIVTSCVIPVVVLLFFAWLIKLLFHVELITPGQFQFHRKKPV
ncbi:MAG: beta-carotene 15,15'-monooxygenase, partial [Lachnospiraceae bacterium]|nr:beta-carotene 15,15'-monooxygenase [Lachnospiraceae bacterium]